MSVPVSNRIVRALAVIGFAVFSNLLAAAQSGAQGAEPGQCGVGQTKKCFVSLPVAFKPFHPSDQKRETKADLKFYDTCGHGWLAPKGDWTDGASIPLLFQGLIGNPWEADYLPAAIVHDHYTDLKHLVRPWRDVVMVFRQAMEARHIPVWKLKLMYYAVYTFGPHHDPNSAGQSCGPNCVFSTLPHDRTAQLPLSQKRGELARVKKLILDSERNAKPLSFDDLERLAGQKHPELASSAGKLLQSFTRLGTCSILQ